MDLSIDVHDRRGVAVVRLVGEVDLATVPLLSERLQALDAAGQTRFVVDLDGVGFVDSTGLGVLIGALKRSRSRGGSMSLVCSDEQLLHVLEATGLDSVFPVHTDLDAALEHVA